MKNGAVIPLVNETNPLVGDHPATAERVDWADPRLARITRLRLLSDPVNPWWDVSYCYGVLKDGTQVDIDLPFYQLPRKGTRAAIVAHARKEKVYALGLGVFAAISTLA